MRSLGVAVALSFVLAACKESPTPPPAPAPSASAAPSATTPPPAPTASTPGADNTLHCPSAVVGTNTALKDVPGGVELTITARDEKDDAVVREIRARALFLAQAAKGAVDAGVHNGSGDVGGLFGRCAVVMRDTAVVAADVATGSKLTVTARDPKEQDWLRRESRARIDELSAPADDAMHAKGVHCPTTVAGASISVSDTATGVALTISAKDAAAAKEIRDRAHALVAAAQLGSEGRAGGGGGHGGGHGDGSGKGGGGGDGAGNGAHNSTGAGGGFGQCPVVVKGTTVDAKDTPDGVTMTVTPKAADALASVRKQVREHVAGSK